MNLLEEAIMKGVERAQMLSQSSWDDWLGVQPEGFLQHEIARAIIKVGSRAFTEASSKKIERWFERKSAGRPASGMRKRFDVVACWKDDARIRAVIEIKRSDWMGAVRGDITKIESYLKQKRTEGDGYVLVYSQVKGSKRVETLESRIRAVEDEHCCRGWRIAASAIRSPRGEQWSWSILLMKLRKNDCRR